MLLKCLDINNKIIYLDSDKIICYRKENDYYVFDTLDDNYGVKEVLSYFENFKTFLSYVFGG